MPLHDVVVTIDGRPFREWTGIEITRQLHELAGSFHLEYDDQVRMQAALPRSEERHDMIRIVEMMPVSITVDGELLMRGSIESVDWEVTGDRVQAKIAGLDPGSDLIECSANPEGPAEYKGLTALEITRKLVAPFGLTVTAEADVGAPIKEFGVDAGESVISSIDKAIKQRAVLVTSDGIGGLVLTTSGTRRAPAPLRLPGNVLSFGQLRNAKERHSDYWVKGQARHGRRGSAPLDGTAHPLPTRTPEGGGTAAHSRRPVSTAGLDGTAYALGEGPAVPTRTISQAGHAAILGAGHAVDPAVTRYRPRVWISRTQSGGSPHQVLAEWRMRIARGRSVKSRYSVAGWRAGDDKRLWRPNEVVSIEIGDEGPFDMLIESVSFKQDGSGSVTQLGVVGREAYDLEPLPDEHRGSKGRGAKGASVSRGAPGQAR